MAARTDFTDAFVLRLVDYGEADRIVTLLTERYGKIAALARGARRSQKRFGAALEPFSRIEVEIGVGRGEVARLAQARIVRVFASILGSLDKMTLAGRAIEWTRLGLPQRLPEPRVLALLDAFLSALDAAPQAEAGLLAGFLARLADALGFSPRFDACGVCGRVAPDGKPGMFDPHLGALVCRGCGGSRLSMKISADARAKLSAMLGPDWLSHAHDWTPVAQAQALEALEALLRAHVADVGR